LEIAIRVPSRKEILVINTGAGVGGRVPNVARKRKISFNKLSLGLYDDVYSVYKLWYCYNLTKKMGMGTFFITSLLKSFQKLFFLHNFFFW
jgi:hypothetical protein